MTSADIQSVSVKRQQGVRTNLKLEHAQERCCQMLEHGNLLLLEGPEAYSTGFDAKLLTGKQRMLLLDGKPKRYLKSIHQSKGKGA